MPSRSRVIGELRNFQAKNWRFLCFFLVLNSRSQDLGSPKLAHMMLSLIIMLSPNLSFLGFTVSLFIGVARGGPGPP